MSGLWASVPSFRDAMKEYSVLSASMSKQPDTIPETPAKVEPVAAKKKDDSAGVSDTQPADQTAHTTSESLYESAAGAASSMLHSASSHMGDIASAGSLLEKTAADLTTIDVKAGGKVDVDGTLTTNNTVTFALDRNSILYSALASFIAMEAYHYFNK